MRGLWREGLSSAFRTALACAIVGCLSLYSPPSISTLISFPAFSYVTAILIIANHATFGDALRGCCLALYATVQTIGPAMLSLWLLGPGRLSKVGTAVAVAVAAFVVVLPWPYSAHLIAKRLALGQIVLVYVVAYDNGVHTDPLMHPLRLASSTALGVLACLVALLLPYPRLACSQMNESYKLLTKNMLKRLKILIKVISEEDKTNAIGLISQTKYLVTKRTKLLSLIALYQEVMKWEIVAFKNLKSHWLSLIERVEEVDTNLRGMELALTCTNSFTINILNQDLKHGLKCLEEHVSLTIKQPKQGLRGASLTVPESNAKDITLFLQSFQTIPTTHKELPIFFFLFCAQLLHQKPFTQAPTSAHHNNSNENSHKGKEKWANLIATLRNTNFIPAIKFSLSLGLTVFMGLVYSKENGFWAGLSVAVSYVSGREATFRAANVKAQGTVLGTVYGVLGCFVFERFLPIRFLSLLPWFIFTSFLQRSQMYGPAGAISAVIGALLILGRKNFGPPSEFAIARIVETFIGLSCSILVDLIFGPKRASTCAKMEVSQCLATLGESIGSLSLLGGETDLEEKLKRLKMQVKELKKLVVEAEVEPNFWFQPFNSVSYNKLLGSLSRVVELLWFGEHALKFLQQEYKRCGAYEKEDVNMLNDKLEHVKDLICSSIKNLEEISRMKFVEKNNNPCDLEAGQSRECNTCMVSGLGEDGIEQRIGSFLQVCRIVVGNLHSDESEKEVKSQVVLSLSALGFCLFSCIRETIEIEEAITEIVQWENPSTDVALRIFELISEVQTMATNSSNGNGHHETTTKKPPSPSPLRFSKFFQSNMRILVTGGAGFIGSHLVDRLMENEKNEVIVADNYFTGSKDNLQKWIGHPRFELIRHDVTEPLLIEVDQIYHLACPASPIFYKYNPVKTIKTNVIGTMNMLGLAKRVGARILLTSTSEVYGDPLVHPQPESYWGNVNPIGVRSCYDEGKRVAETLMFDYHRQHGLEIRIARIFNTYGPRMNIDDGRVVSNFIAQALRGEPLTVQCPGTQTRSFCYVTDLVDGLIRLMEGSNTGPINLGNPGEFTMTELAETVKELINPDVEIKMVENTPDDPKQRKPDITKAKELLGWEPKVKLRDGLPLMEENFRLRLGVGKKN
ncbi:hypothetical protein VNO80_27790 [Phaseolus coccineus]|uniref:UDP-glucuronate decarboxylase n=1 Tax=Phaseolus coccineus TaxID=3886 RepID=A0AAN9QHN3_PHACN